MEPGERRGNGSATPVARLLALLASALALLPASAGGAAEAAPTNQLAGSNSPYLLMHADNPVAWVPWGSEAIARARREQKPIFLSIGYSSCYWCHVMEREDFMNPAIADRLNRWFVSIAVDREERPDLDAVYMTATQLMTGGGGWPNSLFLTPELEPFYAASYIPPDDHGGTPGFATVLERLHDAWTNHRDHLQATAARIGDAVRHATAELHRPATEVPGPTAARASVEAIERRFDPRFGGFGPPPKFPQPGNLCLLWRAADDGDVKARSMVLDTLRAMGRGGIFDQLGGGFHRYTTDREWRVPHFEKMLYDNALLGQILARAAAELDDPELGRLARMTLDFALRRLRLPEGGFASAIDAESPGGEEGAYYTWTRAELDRVLGPADAAFLAPVLGFAGPPGVGDDRYVLYLPRPLGDQATALGMDRARFLARLEPLLEKLRAARSGREEPFRDDKVLADWNGMMIAALADGGRLLGEPRYLAAARRAAEFVLGALRDGNGRRLHAWRLGKASIPAFLDDYAYLMRGLLALERATGEERWLAAARDLAGEMEERLRDPAGGYDLTSPDPDLLVEPKSVTGGVVPAGNTVAILDLLELARRTGETVYRQRADAALRAFAGDLDRYPAEVPMLALAVLDAGEPAQAEPAGAEVTTEGKAAGERSRR